MTEKILKNPAHLDRLYALRAGLAGTDRDDHLEEINEWERKIKRALIFLNLKEHEGIPDLLARANQEIKEINARLLSEELTEGEYSPEKLISASIERQRLYDLRSVWMWFKSLFEDANNELKAADAFLMTQEDDAKLEDEYVGDE